MLSEKFAEEAMKLGWALVGVRAGEAPAPTWVRIGFDLFDANWRGQLYFMMPRLQLCGETPGGQRSSTV